MVRVDDGVSVIKVTETEKYRNYVPNNFVYMPLGDLNDISAIYLVIRQRP